MPYTPSTALVFERLAPASTALVFGQGASIPTANVALAAALPGPGLHISVTPNASAALAATLPGPSVLIKLTPLAELGLSITLPAVGVRISAVPGAQVAITVALPGLSTAITLRPALPAAIVMTLPGPAASLQTDYLSNTQRPTIARLHTLAQIGAPLQTGATQPQQHASSTSAGTAGRFEQAQSAPQASHIATFANASTRPTDTAAQFDDAQPRRDTQSRAPMQEAERQWQRFYAPFQEADRLAAARLAGRFEDGLNDRRATVQSQFQEAQRLPARRYSATVWPAVPISAYRAAPFEQAVPPPPGRWVRPTVVPIVPTDWGTALLFACPPLTAPHLLFGITPCPTAPVALFQILPARFYMTIHSIYAQRLPDLADVPLFEATVSADSGSYCWSLSASGPANLFELLAPVAGLPAQLRLTLDGIPWVFAIDSISRSAQFGKTGATIQGRSLTALIAAPYVRSESRIEPDDKTAQQLALGNLANTGINLDWGVGAGANANSGMIDWLVPAGAYSRQGTPLEAVSRIVQAAGGYLQSHRSSATLLTRHPYGTRAGDTSGAPWDWMTGAADVELAPDALITESVDRNDGPDLNAVYVSGTTAGVLALVKRTGTAADKLADMVTDSLITHADAARQRGLAVLGAAGRKYAVRLDLPVLTGVGQPGVLDVGQLVQVNTATPWRGRVRGVSVSAKRPSLRQTITLERHVA